MNSMLATDTPGEAPDETTIDTPVEAPIEATAEAPAEAVVEALAEPLAEAAVEATVETTVEAVVEVVVETAAKPVETTAEPVEATVEPIETTVEPVEMTAEPIETTAEPLVAMPEPVVAAPKPPPEPLKPPPPPLPLEILTHNERMRHIPAVEWMVQKVDGDVRRRIDLILEVLRAAAHDDPQHAAIEATLRLLCRCLDRLAEAARHSRANHAPHEIGAHLHWSLDHALQNLRSLDPETFGRREPFHHFERSRAESVYGALLSVLTSVDRAIIPARAVDPTLDERLYADLVKLETPMRREALSS
jgi:hypothetical protein